MPVIYPAVSSSLRIATQPTDQTVNDGNSVSFTLTPADGTPGYTYEWFEVGNATAVGTAQTLNFNAAQTTANDGKSYYCVVTDAASATVTSNAATLTVVPAGCPLPTLVTPLPAILNVAPGGNLTIAATGGGATTWVVEWNNAGTWSNLASGTGNDATWTGTGTVSAAYQDLEYRVIFTNTCGDTTTTTMINVTTALAISVHPTNQSGTGGATFTVTATGGTTPYTYSWRRVSDNTIMGTSQTLTMDALTAASNDGESFHCIVTDSASATVTSNDATYTATSCARTWWNPPTRTIFAPSGAGVNRNVTTAAQLTAALNASAPGDCINLATGNYGVVLWRGTIGHASGTAAAPITLQAQAGATPVFTGAGPTDNWFAFLVTDIEHIRVSGIEATNGQFTARFGNVKNAYIGHNNFHHSGHSTLVINSQNGGQSENVLVEGNEISWGGQANVNFGEGIYIGYGSDAWLDFPDNIEIRYNDIHHTRGDCVDIKPGSTNIEVHHNKIHDADCPLGGVITHANNIPGDFDPTHSTEKPILIHDNRIWNIGWDAQGTGLTSEAYAFYVSEGGEKIWNNVVWGIKPTGSNTRGVNVRVTTGAPSGSTPFPIEVWNNTIWVDDSFVWVDTSPNSPKVQLNHWNNLTPDGAQGATTVTAAVFVSAPAVNTQSTAGSPEGSGFIPATATSVPATTSTVPATDITGVSRPQDTRSEQGAIEYCV